ncbi:DUF4157 domain-containing protein [Streptomyces sp. NPDC048106]|uniref:eCIS core domain-containing protein n=1 Tax=Streptomyces sp. NPDC048106 TaxID=3155750 RepID=UPI0034545CF7
MRRQDSDKASGQSVQRSAPPRTSTVAHEAPAFLGLQRSIGNAAVARAVQELRVQRMPRELRQTASRQQREAADMPYSPRLRAQRGNANAVRVVTPRRDALGRDLWQGGRAQLGFPDTVQDQFYNSLNSQTDGNGVATYCCENCENWVPRKRDAPRGSKDFATIDHKRGIISRVSEEEVQEVQDSDGHTFDAMLLADAQAAAWDMNNLRMLCSRCNSSDGRVSESRTTDNAGPKHRSDCPACAAAREADEDEEVQRLATSAHASHADADEVVQTSAVRSVLGSAGRPLDAGVRADMEARLGADFSDVRVHTGAAARRSAAEVNARAYTSGNHVVIGDGGGDRHTLAHELTHVIQQRSGPVAGTDNGSGLRVSDPSDRFEREAEANARRALAGSAPVLEAEAEGHAAGAGARPVQRMEAEAPAQAPAPPRPLRDVFREADQHAQFDEVFWTYVGELPDDMRAKAGKDKSVERARTVWAEVQAERDAAAIAAQQELEQRKLTTKANDRGTWVMHPDIVYLNGASPDQLKATTREQLAANQLRANGVGNDRFEPALNMRCHVHGLTDSQGIAFAYLLEEDYRVRAYVYDTASKRTNGNQYVWTAGGRGGYNSGAPIPGLAASETRVSQLPQG